MSEIASRDLRHDTRAVLRRVEDGEDITITVAGRPVAVLRPLSARGRWMSSAEVLRRLDRSQTDAALTRELHDLNPETTDIEI